VLADFGGPSRLTTSKPDVPAKQSTSLDRLSSPPDDSSLSDSSSLKNFVCKNLFENVFAETIG
jgi:hypothetical protein